MPICMKYAVQGESWVTNIAQVKGWVLYLSRDLPRAVYLHTKEVAVLEVSYCILYLKMLTEDTPLNFNPLLNKKIDFFDNKLIL